MTEMSKYRAEIAEADELRRAIREAAFAEVIAVCEAIRDDRERQPRSDCAVASEIADAVRAL